MSQSLVNEFIDRRKAGEPLGSSLKEAIFQAKTIEYYDEDDEESKFELFKMNMRGLLDEEPVYVRLLNQCASFKEHLRLMLASLLAIGGLLQPQSL
jgi:hypothetical protein